MTPSELARDKLKYWDLIGRARKVGMPVPEKWMKYGEAPTKTTVIINVCFDAVLDKLKLAFEVDDKFYDHLFKK